METLSNHFPRPASVALKGETWKHCIQSADWWVGLGAGREWSCHLDQTGQQVGWELGETAEGNKAGSQEHICPESKFCPEK